MDARPFRRRRVADSPAAPAAPPTPIQAVWTPSPNYWPGRPYGPPIAFVLHTESGTEAATAAWFGSSNSQVSAHFGAGLDGQLQQFVALEHRAWANGVLEHGNRWDEVYSGPAGVERNPNHWTVSCETEDLGDGSQPVTDAQFAAVLGAVQLALAAFPTITTLLRHADISPQSRVNCPGRRWTASGRFDALAAATGLRTLP